MPDLTRPPRKLGAAPQGAPYALSPGRLFRPHTSPFVVPYFRVDSDGVPGPALEIRHVGAFRILWPVRAGPRSFSVWCRHSGHTPRPRVRIAADPALGVNSDVTAEALDTPDWHRIQISVTPTADGVLEVYLEVRAVHSWARWDNVEVS
jgi:hypothetical protein